MNITGTVGLREFYVADKKPFTLNEYLITPDNILMEVVDVVSLPNTMSLPEGMNQLALIRLGFQENEPLYLAKATVIKNLATPIKSLTEVRKATFAEMEHLLIHGHVQDSFHLGVVVGTESSQKELPEELSNISPLWKDKRAIHQEGIPFIMDYREQRVYPHIGVFGTSGSGKSFGLRVFCEELMRKRIPGIAFDPHFELQFNKPMAGLEDNQKIDFSALHETFQIGRNVGITFSELSLDELIHLIEYVGPLTEPQVGALEVLYEKGDTLAHLMNKINNLKAAFIEKEKPERDQSTLTPEQLMLYLKLKDKVSGEKTLQAMSWKLDALEKTNIFNGDTDGVERAIKHGKLAILRGDLKRLQMISSYILKKFYKKRRDYQDAREKDEAADFFPMFFTVIDEAHNFAPKHDNNPTKRILRTIAQEARKYGIFEIFCTQKPNVLDETILAQLNTKVIYRLNTAKDMEMVKMETNLTEEQTKMLPSLASGHCYVSSPLLPKTFFVRFRTTFTESPHVIDPFDEFSQFQQQNNHDGLDEELIKLLPISSVKMAEVQEKLVETMKKSVSISSIMETLKRLEIQGDITSKKTPFGIEYRNK